LNKILGKLRPERAPAPPSPPIRHKGIHGTRMSG
jgi:hypothetical protein